MKDETTDRMELLRERILDEIGRSKKEKWTIKIKTLMAEFGFNAVQRVRQSSFLAVLDMLNQWEIAYNYSGNTANDYITLSRSRLSQDPALSKHIVPQSSSMLEDSFEGTSPLAFLFHIGEGLEESPSQSLAVDVQNALWSFQPVCLLVEAGDEFFSFICGFISAIMRRRALMVRHGVLIGRVPLAPDIITTEYLKRFMGQTTDLNSQIEFPQSGAVYILRDSPDDIEDDDMFASVRECFIPHTYRIRAKYATTSGEISQGARAVDSPGFDRIVKWMSGFAGTFQLSQPSTEQKIDLASLLAEASQTRDALLERQALRKIDSAFRAGFESTEHMAIKSALLSGLRQRYPEEKITVEETVDSSKDNPFADPDTVDIHRRDKPDLRVENALWIEVETMRALSLRGSNPFFVLESKLRQKLTNMRAFRELWLIVPNDIALLASEQLCAVTRNLNAALGSDKLRCGFVDILKQRPVFLNSLEVSAPDVRLKGISWRTPPKPLTSTLTWDDIAGYGDLKERLREDLLDPLLYPEKYSKHGLLAANGLLLYGLPGCGKSLIGRVLAGETGLLCRLIVPSDMTSMWLGEGVMKIRALFDWALKQSPCLLVLDELDAVAPQRKEAEMHTDEKRQVNELLAQLDRISGKGVVVVATTNYVRGIDTAIQRSGRFDVKLPVFPPDEADRAKIFEYYLSAPRLKGFRNQQDIDIASLAAEAILFTPADIKTVVQTAARQAIRQSNSIGPSLDTEGIYDVIYQHPRSIRYKMAQKWVKEVAEELGHQDKRLAWLEEEITNVSRKYDR
jgi:ATP-dependent 26S proteasome regulatory subunit